MKLSLLALAAAAGLASCQCPSSIPECAQSCLMIAAGSVGCGETDYACQCTDQHQTDITTNATTCVLAACGEQTALRARVFTTNADEVLPAASAFCSAINAGESCESASAGSTSGTAAPSGSSTEVTATASLLPTTDSTTTRTATPTEGSSTATSSESSGSTGSATGASASASSTAGAATMGSVGSLGIAVLGALVML